MITLEALKADAKKQYSKIGLPTQKWETWKYAPLKDFNPDKLDVLTDSKDENLPELNTGIESKIIFLNGVAIKQDSLPTGLSFNKLDDASDSSKELIFKELLKNNQPNPFYYKAIDTENTYVFEISKNEVLTTPIFLDFQFSLEMKNKQSATSLYFISHESSESVFIESIRGLEENSDSFVNISKSFLVKQNSNLSYGEDSRASDTPIFNSIYSKVKRDAVFDHFIFSHGGPFTRSDVLVELTENGAHTGSYGLFTLDESRKSFHHTIIDHLSAHTTSEQLYKGILQDTSHGVFDGQVLVRKDAQKVDSQQLNKNLVLGKASRVDSKPQLIIDADDVKCAHGSTIGQLEEDSLFYLQTRGISRTKGRSLLARAFAFDICEKLNNKQYRKYFENRLKEEFEKRDFSKS